MIFKRLNWPKYVSLPASPAIAAGQPDRVPCYRSIWRLYGSLDCWCGKTISSRWVGGVKTYIQCVCVCVSVLIRWWYSCELPDIAVFIERRPIHHRDSLNHRLLLGSAYTNLIYALFSTNYGFSSRTNIVCRIFGDSLHPVIYLHNVTKHHVVVT